MSELQTVAENNIPLLERYLLADSPSEFLEKETKLPQEKQLFSLLLDPPSEKDADNAKKLGLSKFAREKLETAKTWREVRKMITPEQQQELLTTIQKLNPSIIFDFPPPPEVSATNVLNQLKSAESKQTNELETEGTVAEVVAKALKDDPRNFAKLSLYGLRNIPNQLLKTFNENQFHFLFSKPEVIRALDPTTVAELIKTAIEKAMKNKQSSEEEEFPEEFYNTLTLEQIEALKTKLPNVFKGYSYYRQQFRQKYEEALSSFKPIPQLSFEQQEEKRRLCERIVAELKKEGNEFGFFFIEKLTEEILLIEEALFDTSLERFVGYLSGLKSVNYDNLDNRFREEIKAKYGRNRMIEKYHQPLDYLDSATVSQNDLISRTIVSLLKSDDSKDVIPRLAPYISRAHLLKEEAKVLLAKGRQKEIANLYDLFTMQQLNELKEKKKLTFSPSNRKVYRSDESVQLKLTAKNVKTIAVKLFAIDLEKQYLENKCEINEQTNLKFLVPLEERKEEYLLVDLFEEKDIAIDVPELDGRLGLFIVQLEAEGVTSRAVIRKGTIVVKNQITTVGHQLTFYDENGKQIETLSLWRDNKKVEVSGSYTIPFGSQGRELIIPVYRGYAQREYVDIRTEQYSLLVDYVYHSESFIVGHKAKVILRPKLVLGADSSISLSRLNKATLKVTTVNNQGISQSVTQENVVFQDAQDFVLSLPVKSYLTSVSIDLEVQIEKIDGSKQKLNQSRSIAIDLEEGNNNLIDTYLDRCDKGVYTLRVKGKNGEPIPNAAATFSYEQFGADFSFSRSLIADENGTFVLGQLAQVKKLTAAVTHNGFASNRTWRLNDFAQSISYGGHLLGNSCKLYLNEGESLSLPLPCPLSQNDVIFYREHPTLGTISNCLPSLRLDARSLTAQNMGVGRYTLILLRFDRRIDLQVIKGRQWIGGDLIDKENTIYKLDKKREYLSLGPLTAQPKEDGVDCQIELLGAKELPKGTRLHVFAKNYIDSENSELLNCSQSKCIPNETQKLQIKASAYYSDKSLSDETSYVLNRRKQDITAGNNLEKPHIFLKRIEVRDTTTKDEQLKAEGVYRNKMAEESYDRMYCKAAPRMMAQCARADDMYGNFFVGSYLQPQQVTITRKLNSHNNFLKEAGFLSQNITTLGTISVPKGYSQLLVILIGKDVTIKREYSLPHAQPETISLTHTALVDASQKEGWTMSREIYPTLAGQTREISRNCTWTTVSKSNVIDFARTRGHSLPDWLSNWQSYSPEKQLEVYDKEFCHELNFFLYKNDKLFFNKVVRPFLSNRLHKTFVDLYLTENEDVLQYASSHRLEKLNFFERALLVERLRAFGRQKEAESLALSMELPLKNAKQSGEAFKIFFQTILNAKKIDQKLPPPPPPPVSAQFAYGGMAMNCPPPPGVSLFGMPPQAPQQFAFQSKIMMEQECCGQVQQQGYCVNYQQQCDDPCLLQKCEAPVKRFQKAQKQYKPGFKETEKTKEYTDTTYAGVTNPAEYPLLVSASLFWAQLARHYCSAKQGTDFLSDKFWSFSSRRQFILACSVLPAALEADYELANEQGNYKVIAKNSFLIFSREVKSLPYAESKSIVINQRFFNQKDKYAYDEEGTQIEKEVQHFAVLKPYTLQTIVTNISGSALEVQLLMDIPEGAVPLKSHEQTKIINVSLQTYSTQTFEREFYFPAEGTFSVYPANASRNRSIIAKGAPFKSITVTLVEPVSKKETLSNILRSGTDQEVFAFLQNRNIFDNNLFDFRLILWKLKNKGFYERCVEILRQRNYFQPIVWSFGLLHKDFKTVLEFFESRNRLGLGTEEMERPVFEYYPYYSSRVHKFADENKSTIRVREFRENYAQFLLATVFEGKQNDPTTRLALIYYLMLQDRVADARKLHSRTQSSERKQHQLQYDYLDCFLDMSSGGEDKYSTARKISEQYQNYPVAGWQKLFKEVYETLTKSAELDTEEESKGEEATFATTVTNALTEIKINRPAQTKVTVNFYKVDLELYFSEFPFQDISTFSSTIAPTKSEQFHGDSFQVHTLLKKDYEALGDCIVEVYEHKQSVAPSKVSRFLWGNPQLKVRVNENEGTLKVFHAGKKCSTSYCKVYSRGSKGDRFYRDGYTDIASTFRYALDQKDISEFSILVLTDFGGVLHRVKPPALQ